MLSFFSTLKSDEKKKEALKNNDLAAKMIALDKSLAIIEFEPTGKITAANANFLALMGYELAEIKGRHHSLFVDDATKNSDTYKMFWQALQQGNFTQDVFKRRDKHGKTVWLQATYNPVFDDNNHVYKVIKFATDITQEKQQAIDFDGQMSAINKSLAVVEFDMQGHIITANKLFLDIVGYTLGEIKGQHHRLLVSKDYANTKEYTEFWQRLEQGKHETNEFMRINKQGQEVWIQASYNPILDFNSQPYKVVKYATDITQQKIERSHSSGQIEAINKSQAVIEFDLNGMILYANENFLDTMGYAFSEIQGKHHSIFVTPEYARSAEYRNFWAELQQGQFQSAEYKRLTKNGKDVWILASYNPIFDPQGKPCRVIKYATDITQDKLIQADFSGQISAISKSQAVIEFNMDGTVRTANDNFLSTVNYSLADIEGRHHSMFVDSKLKNSAEYHEFWKKLQRGQYIAGEFKRLGKGAKEIWIQASYNPIMDANGEPFKVVKYASNITDQKNKNANFKGQLQAISKSQAVIEFNLDGTIITANDNFLQTMGYKLEELQGKHHSLFVEPDYRDTEEYTDFWKTLREGNFIASEFKRVAKNNQAVWIQASYNPIYDTNNKPFKVVKYATDITAQKEAIALIGDSLFALSEGDLTKIITQSLGGEFNLLGQAMNATLDRLNRVFKEIAQRAKYVSTSAQEIQSGSANLSQRTEEQAASLEQSAASVEELTSTAAQNSTNADYANKLSIEATSKAEYGGDVITDTIGAMAEIESASKKISDIISVIDEIAFQTNLLALNAAVEAARAGEQGRGFAVVAGEVRNLAQRSASAAKEIKTLINDSVSKVADGTELANKSGSTLTEIVAAIKSVSELIAEINRASQEQTDGIQQVNTTVMQMDAMTQQNASMVEQASAASTSMSNQADELLKLISFFRTG